MPSPLWRTGGKGVPEMLKEIVYVYAVYQERSFSKAAQKLFISQPALSAMVKKAEQEIRTPIFDRSTNPISLTTAGQYYIRQVEKILKIQGEMESYFQVLAESSTSQLRLGGSSFFLSYIFPPMVSRFEQRYGKLSVSWQELRNMELISKLLDRSIDFFLEVDDLRGPQIASLICGEERVILAVPAGWQVNEQLREYRLTAEEIHDRKHLSGDVPAVDLRTFADLPYILLREGNDSFQRAVAICRNAGFTPKPSMLVDQVLTSYYLAAEGNGVAFVRDSILFYADMTEKLYFYYIDDPLATRPVYLYYKKDTELSPVAQAFLQFLEAG